MFDYSHRWAVKKYPHDLSLEPNPTPKERLRAFIRAFLLRGLGDGFPTWHAKLLAQETANPSGILSKLAETVIRPMDEYLEGVIRELLEKEDPSRKPDIHSIQLCRMNISGQCIIQLHMRQVTPCPVQKSLGPRQIVALADRIYRFSLEGIRAIAAEEQSQ